MWFEQGSNVSGRFKNANGRLAILLILGHAESVGRVSVANEGLVNCAAIMEFFRLATQSVRKSGFENLSTGTA